jgi:hypothetical protein
MRPPRTISLALAAWCFFLAWAMFLWLLYLGGYLAL